jgi:hypothetical protein
MKTDTIGDYPTKEKCYLVGVHRYCFRAGVPAEITGVKMCQPSVMADYRFGYEIEFSDGKTDIVPVSEIGIHWKMITFLEILNGEIPPITE